MHRALSSLLEITPTKWQKQHLNFLLLTQISMQVSAGKTKTSPTLQKWIPEPGRKGKDKDHSNKCFCDDAIRKDTSSALGVEK